MATRFTGDVTRAGILAYAQATAQDPSTVGEVTHEAFNADQTTGGFAVHYDGTLFIAGTTGGQSWAIDPVNAEGRAHAIESFWRVAKRHNRRLTLADLPDQTRAAVDALLAGARSVSDLRPQPLGSDEERAGADYALVLLRRGAKAASESAALRAIARQDVLLAPIPAHSFAHRCPLCGNPALGSPRYDRAVCDDCYATPACEHGRRVTGYNANLAGGFEALHPDDRSACDLTTTTGRVTINGIPALMAEARFGGVVISAVVPPAVELPSLPDAEAALIAAQRVSDVAALDALIADELVFTGPDGTTLGKQDDLTAHRTGATTFQRLDVLHTRTHVLPTLTGPARGTSSTTAQVALATSAPETQGSPLELTLRWDLDWCVIDGRWQIVKASAAVVS